MGTDGQHFKRERNQPLNLCLFQAMYITK